jgi:hypothetical protein
MSGPASSWTSSLVSTIKSPRIETIVLRASFFKLADVESLDWATLEKTFAQPHFADLQTFEVCLPRSPSDFLILDAIRGKLPACEARGLIRLSRPMTQPTPFADFLHPVTAHPPVPRHFTTHRRLFRLLLQKLRRWLRKRNPSS